MDIIIKNIEGAMATDHQYHNILKNAIEDVFRKIGENFDDVIWIICKDRDLPLNVYNGITSHMSINPVNLLIEKSEPARRSLYAKYPFRFACTDYKNNTVYIAEEAIILNYRDYASYAKAVINPRLVGLPYIIIDELSHIKTGLDHSDEVYDKQLYKYTQLYNQ